MTKRIIYNLPYIYNHNDNQEIKAVEDALKSVGSINMPKDSTFKRLNPIGIVDISKCVYCDRNVCMCGANDYR
jgi:hypothetical protein